MGIKYNLYKDPPSKAGEETGKLHPRIMSQKTFSLDWIAKRVAGSSAFTEGDVIGVWQNITKELKFWLQQGYRVELNGLGFFSLVLEFDEKWGREENNPRSIRFRDVNFRCGKEFKKHFNDIELERGVEIRSVEYTGVQRERRLRCHFNSCRFITSAGYAQLMKCSRTRALRELNVLIKQGVLSRQGNGNVTLYFREE